MPTMPPTFRPAGQRSKSERVGEYDQKREPWRKWYSLAIWRALKLGQLRREPLCANCLLVYDDIVAATVVHHIDPHRGDWSKFTNPDNLESVCKPCHDGEIQRGERAGWSGRGGYVDGQRIPPRVLYPLSLSPSAIPLTMVCGPPGAGKSTYVDQHKGPDDIVIDIDAILHLLSGDVMRTKERRDRFLLDAFIERNKRLASLHMEQRKIAAWFIIGAPKHTMREAWAKQLKPHDVVVIGTSERVCKERIEAEPLRSPTAATMIDGVIIWWSRYEPAECDTKFLNY